MFITKKKNQKKILSQEGRRDLLIENFIDLNVILINFFFFNRPSCIFSLKLYGYDVRLLHNKIEVYYYKVLWIE